MTDSKNDNEEKKSAGESDDETSKSRIMSRFSRRTLLIGGLVFGNLFVVGMLAAYVMLRPAQVTVVEAPKTEPIDPLQTISRGDALLLGGRTQEAIELYKTSAKVSSPHTSAVAYRLGISGEIVGDLAEALRYYQIANNQDLSETSIAAQLGEARVYYQQNDFQSATRILTPLAGLSALPVLSNTRLGAEVSFMRSLTYSARSQSQLPTSLMDPRHLFRENLDLFAANALQLVPIEGNPLSMRVPIGDDTRVGIKILGQASTPSTTLASCGFQGQQAAVLLELIARETGWKIKVSAAANDVLTAARVEVQLRDKTIGEILTVMLESPGLFWAFQEDTLLVDQIEQFPPELVADRYRTHANSLLLDALAEAPSHSLAPQAYLALGNLAVMNQRPEQAVVFYKDVRQRYPKNPVAQRASLNLAKTLLAQSKRQQAEETLYDIIDSRAGSQVIPLAFLLLGDLHLAAEDLEKAKQELSRGLALATQAEIRAAAAMTLAAVYLMQRTDSASSTANAVLMENRDILRDERWAEAVVFLSALTRYRVALRPADVRRTGRELINAATKVDPGSFFGGYGYLLVGDAFSELSLASEATRLYAEGAKQRVPEPVRDILLYRLGTEQRQQNDLTAAKRTFEKLVKKPKSGLAPKAAIDLADLFLQDGQLQDCVDHCRDSLAKSYTEQQNIALLRVLGHAYQELGQHEQASLCFAGFLPSPSPLQTAELSR